MEKAEALQRIYGESGSALLPVLKNGSAGLKAMRQEARDLGLVMSNEATVASERFQDSLTKVRGVLKGLRNQIGVALLPIMTSLIDGFRSFIRVNGQFIRQRIDRFMDRVRDAVDFVRRALERADEVVRLRVGGWPVLFEQVNKAAKLAGAIAGLATFIKLLRIAQLLLLSLFAPGAPVILGIIALTAAMVALVLVGEDLLVFARGGESAIGRFLEAMDPELAIQLKDALNGLGDAIRDLQAISEEAFASIGIDLTSLREFFGATFGSAALAAIRKFTDDVANLREGLEAIPTVLDVIGETIAAMIRIIDPALAKLERFTGEGGVLSAIRGALLGAAEQREVSGGFGGAAGRAQRRRTAGTTSTALERREAGAEARRFRESGGIAAVESQTRRERQIMESLAASVSIAGDTITIQALGTDVAEVEEMLNRRDEQRLRQAMANVEGVSL